MFDIACGTILACQGLCQGMAKSDLARVLTASFNDLATLEGTSINDISPVHLIECNDSTPEEMFIIDVVLDTPHSIQGHVERSPIIDIVLSCHI